MQKLINPTQENWFDFWAEDAIKLKFIKKVILQDTPFIIQLPIKHRIVEKTTVYSGSKIVREEIDGEKEKIALNGIEYGCDRIILWDEISEGIFYCLHENWNIHTSREYFVAHRLPSGAVVSFLDVKAPAGYGGSNSSDVSFSINSKLVYTLYGYYINKVMLIPNKKLTTDYQKSKYLWLSTYTPERYFITDGLTKARTISNYKPITIKQFIKNET